MSLQWSVSLSDAQILFLQSLQKAEESGEEAYTDLLQQVTEAEV